MTESENGKSYFDATTWEFDPTTSAEDFE